MPELPEVETVCRGLSGAAIDAPIISVWRSPHNLRVGRDWQRDSEGTERLMGFLPGRVQRRGKYILWHMRHSQQPELRLVIHLGMSGRCGVVDGSAPKVAHTHLVLTFADQRELRFVDPRRFGGLKVGTDAAIFEDWPPLRQLGIEPLSNEFNGRALRRVYGKSRRCIRDALLDQRGVAGIGNIYAVEACFMSRVHPLREAASLTAREWGKLARALVRVLEQGIANGGTTLAHFRDVTGEVGRNQDDLSIYGRGALPCPRCRACLEDFKHGGRSGVFCARCQPR